VKRLILCVCVLTAIPLARARSQAASPGLNAPRPIDAFDSVFLEQLTWLEVRDAIRAGKTTAIIPTGAIEPNGPYLALGKHNYVLQATTERIARKLGAALVAPIVPFVPGGDIDPPSGHMRYPGTISLQQSTFRLLLTDIARSLKTHGFTRIILIGDSGGNQDGMRDVAEALSAEWKGSGNTIHFIPEYYDNPRWKRWLEGHGIHEVDEGLHDDVRHSAIMMVVDPSTVRMEQRLEAGLFSINGIPLAPAERTIELGNSLIDYQADVTVEAIRRVTGGQ
jgi:creatinine amidohydrolase/Fe(II)-dependent formamide hydrolase-like protein